MRPEVNGSDTNHVVCQGYSLNIFDVNIQVYSIPETRKCASNCRMQVLCRGTLEVSVFT